MQITYSKENGEVACKQLTPKNTKHGLDVKRGVYHLTDGDKRKIRAWLGNRGAA